MNKWTRLKKGKDIPGKGNGVAKSWRHEMTQDIMEIIIVDNKSYAKQLAYHIH